MESRVLSVIPKNWCFGFGPEQKSAALSTEVMLWSQQTFTAWWWRHIKSWGISKVNSIHPLGTMNICTVHPRTVEIFNSRPKLSISTQRRIRGASKSVGFILWEPQISVKHFMAVLDITFLFTLYDQEIQTDLTQLKNNYDFLCEQFHLLSVKTHGFIIWEHHVMCSQREY